jgi:hypothetical protein
MDDDFQAGCLGLKYASFAMSSPDNYTPDPRAAHIAAGQKYTHFKGEVYEIIGVGIHTETEETMVFYRDIQTERLFARPLTSFLSPVVGERAERFVLIQAGQE